VAFDRDAQRLQSVVDLSRPADIDQGDVVDKAWVPVQVQALTARIARSRGIEAREGVIVTRVYPTDSEIEAHLTVGDVITHINDRVVPCSHVRQAEVFHSMIRRFTPGDTVTLRRIRGETPQRVTFTLRAFPRMPGKKDLYTSTHLGFVARELVLMDRLKMRLSPSTEGVLISEVKEGSWAALANCAVDDIVCAVNGQPVTSIEEMKKEIATAEKRNREHVIFRIQRGIHTLFLELKTDWNDENEFE
jgi:serine protease Do